MWIFTFSGKGHCLLCFRAPRLVYSEAQEGSVGFIYVLLSWKKGWIEHLITHFLAGPKDSSSRVTTGPFSLQSSADPWRRDTQLNSKVQILHPCIQAFTITSFPPVIWEGDSMHGDSMHAFLAKTKSWCTVSVLTAVTVPTGVTDSASSGLSRNRPGS